MDKILKKFNEDNYYTRDEIKYRISKNENLDKVWNLISSERKLKGYTTPFKSQENSNFFYYIREEIKGRIKQIEGKNIEVKLREKVKEALIDEAISSSAIEGAFLSYERLNELVEGQSLSKDEKEVMVLNNYDALKFIDSNVDAEINDKFILKIHKIITNGTIDENDLTERYRTDHVEVINSKLKTVYKAPEYEKVEELMKKLIVYINTETDEHIFIKASIIQFIFLYIHPFFDGNGRTARALTYMYLIKNGYNIFKSYSLSSSINNHRSQYYKSILKCEDKDGDLTYFIDFIIRMMLNSISKLNY